MQVTEVNDVKVYNLSAAKSLPQWLEEARKTSKSLRYNEEFRRRIDLIQDFEFNVASTKVAVSADGECIAAAGIYAPEVRLFDTRATGMRCSRGLNCEVVDFQFLSDDWRKLVFLMADRNVEFHSQFGFHHRVRVPKAGRSIAYDYESCSLLVGGFSSEVYRLDLEVGMFQTPINLRDITEVYQVAVNPCMPIVSCAGDQGLVETFDLRDPSKPLRNLQAALPDGANTDHVTACTYSRSGMYMSTGSSSGVVRVYDVRSSKPLSERDQMNGYAIRSVCFHHRLGSTKSEDLLVGSADAKSVKIWEAGTSKLIAAIENKSTINQLTFLPDTGMFLTANDTQRIGTYFVPALGIAPKWCSFLDNITEELEENAKRVVFDDYQFVTSDDLEQLGAGDLVGSKYLQPYMHGYFMAQKLHTKLKTAMDPFRFEEYRKEQVKRKLEEKRTMRTKVKKTKSKVDVNNTLHQRLSRQADSGTSACASKKTRASADVAKGILQDDRFSAIFENPDMAVEGWAAPKVETVSEAIDSASKRPRRGRKRKLL